MQGLGVVCHTYGEITWTPSGSVKAGDVAGKKHHLLEAALKSILVLALTTLCPGAAFAGAADGLVIARVGYGPKTVATITGPRTALMLVEGTVFAVPAMIQETEVAKVFRVAHKMFFAVAGDKS